MPRLEAARVERRKAEEDVKVIKARIRLLRETAEANEKKLRLGLEKQARHEIIQGDAEWMRDTLENEQMRREMMAAEKKSLAAEQRDVTQAQLTQSKALVANARVEVGIALPPDTQLTLRCSLPS